MVERLEPNCVGIASGSEADVRRYIESDFLIRSGMCPNGHGLMSWNGAIQQCGTCHFLCNTRPELASQ